MAWHKGEAKELFLSWITWSSEKLLEKAQFSQICTIMTLQYPVAYLVGPVEKQSPSGLVTCENLKLDAYQNSYINKNCVTVLRWFEKCLLMLPVV